MSSSKRKIVSFVAALACSSLFLAGCGSGDENEGSEATPDSSTSEEQEAPDEESGSSEEGSEDNDLAVEDDVTSLAAEIEASLVSNPDANEITGLEGQEGPGTVEFAVGDVDAEVTLSDGVHIVDVYVPDGAIANGYVITAYHTNGKHYTETGDKLFYDSAAGGLQRNIEHGDTDTDDSNGNLSWG